VNGAIAKVGGTDRDEETAARSWHRSPTIAWVSLCLAVALHVADEAFHDFLAVYNPSVVVALGLSPFVFRRKSWMRIVVMIVSALMILNALAHLAGSVRTGSVMPGALSSPILLTAAIWSLSRAWTGWNSQ
jgi:hypothetical protein